MTIGKSRADVAIRGSNVSFLVNQMAKTGDLCAEFGFRHVRHSIPASGSFGTGSAVFNTREYPTRRIMQIDISPKRPPAAERGTSK